MKIVVTETVTDSHGITYKRIAGSEVCYHVQTSDRVIEVLENARRNHTRIKVHFGDTDTGRDWNEEHDVIGYVGHSTGRIKIPILVYNERSWGGGALLDHCIVKIVSANGGYVFYQHPNYQAPVVEVRESDLPEYTHAVYIDGELYSRHETKAAAERLARHMLK